MARQVARPHEEGRENRGHPPKRRRGVLLRWLLEGRDAVRNRFGTGHRDAALGESPQHQERQDKADWKAGVLACGDRVDLERRGERRHLVPTPLAIQSHGDEGDHRGNEDVRRQTERGARLADTAQIHHRQQHDRADAEQNGV